MSIFDRPSGVQKDRLTVGGSSSGNSDVAYQQSLWLGSSTPLKPHALNFWF